MSDGLAGIVQVLINQSQVFGIFAILGLSLNLEYGYTGIPNFGKVFFMGLGAFVTGGTVTHLINWSLSRSAEICSAGAAEVRSDFAFTSPDLLTGMFILALVISVLITGGFGYLLSYPALRLRADYLAILLIATGEILRVFVRALPRDLIACEANPLISIPNPLLFLLNFAPPNAPKLAAPFDWVTGNILFEGSYSVVVLAITFVCYLIVSRLSNSPYGRMLKSIRDDEPAALSLGKNPAKVRGQVMIIGSAMAGVAGTLFAFRLESVETSTFVPLLTFITWTVLLLGGAANNRGILLGSIAYISIDYLTFVGRTWAIASFPFFDELLTRAPIDTYAQQIALGAIIILVVLFRPQGILREKPIKTPAWDVVGNGSNSDDKGSQ